MTACGPDRKETASPEAVASADSSPASDPSGEDKEAGSLETISKNQLVYHLPPAPGMEMPAPPHAKHGAAPERQARSARAAGGDPGKDGQAGSEDSRWVVDADSLNVRLAAGADATVLTRLTRGTEVKVLDQLTLSHARRWARIEYTFSQDRRVGWVAADYLKQSSGTRGASENASSSRQFGDFADLHYSPLPKLSYDGNPKVDAKGIHLTFMTLRSARLNRLLEIADETQVNAFVVDFKDDVGGLLAKSQTATRLNPKANEKIAFKDPDKVLKRLKDKGIYLIARIVAFKDPIYATAHPSAAIWDRRKGAVYRSRDGLSWASPHDSTFRAYNIGLAREAAQLGFNEVQFDYVRFPDVPKSADLDYRDAGGETKAGTIQGFLLDARETLAPLRVYVAADVFGLICTTTDDMRIGQYWEAVSNATDFICPMMYPSHYGPECYELDIPDKHPYELIDRGIQDALERNRNIQTPAGIRPWIQGFTASWVQGHIPYGAREIKEQIRALEDNGIDSWLLWHPANRYDPAALN